MKILFIHSIQITKKSLQSIRYLPLVLFQALLRRLEAAKPTKGLNREYLLRSQGGSNKKTRSRPSSACSSGRLSTRTLASELNARDNNSVHTEKSSRKKFSKPAWEAGW